jgi:hypothetical protein
MTLKPGGKYPLMRRRTHFLRRRGPSQQRIQAAMLARVLQQAKDSERQETYQNSG